MTTGLGKEVFVPLTVCVFQCYQFVFVLFPFGCVDGMWYLIVLVPDPCHSFFYFLLCYERDKLFPIVYL